MNVINNQSTSGRIRILYAAIIFVCAIFIFRLFYLQVLQYDYYQDQAQANQLKRYEIPAERGAIFAKDGEESVAFVLNERSYTIVADPQIITDKEATAVFVSEVLGLPQNEVLAAVSADTRYEILAKNRPQQAKDAIEKLYIEGDIVGIFAEKTTRRVYPHGSLGSQILGFVNDDGEGNYGVEQFLDESLAGSNGRVKALTDQNGVPLLANGDNVLEDAVDGSDVTLTIDVAMQKQIETLLENGLKDAQSESGSIIVLDPYTGQIKSMANFPSYDPADFRIVEDLQLFTNASVSSPLEPGSIMKALTAAAALDQGAVTKDTSYFDPGFFNIDDATVRNVSEVAGSGTRSISDILRLSLNTGATYLLMQMGGGEINQEGREAWHDYMVNHYQFGSKTGVEQGFEEPGHIPDPNDGFGLNIQYANTAFGQGMTVTPLQMAAALASVVNGGTYYQPTLVAGQTDTDGNYTNSSPKVVSSNVVSRDTADTIIQFMNNVVVNNNRTAARDGYQVGGKTGTAEIARPEGGYFEDKFNGTYVGYVGGDSPEYVVMVRVNEPGIAGYAGSRAAGPVFSSVINMLIDNFSVQSITGQ
ncbi:MAG: cell division protein FtsI (penicillin-binding protein 3) [Candidatus Saccharimonadales bacterium]|jgi:cell division protein FtsI (penicillin-binding protein 3)